VRSQNILINIGNCKIADMDLKPFDASALSLDSYPARVMVFIGRRATGKTKAVKNVLRMNSNSVSDTVVINPTENNAPDYAPLIASCMSDKKHHGSSSPYGVTGIHQNMDDGILENIIHRTSAPDYRRTCLVLDNCVYDTRAWNRSPLRDMFTNNRQLDVTTLVTMQYPMGIPPSIRCNIDYVFLFRDNTQANRKRVFDDYCGSLFPTFESFCETLDKYTQRSGDALVLRLSGHSYDLQKNAFWYNGNDPTMKHTDNVVQQERREHIRRPETGNKRARTTE